MNVKRRKYLRIVFSVFTLGMIFFAETANSTVTTVESDTFIRCLIGECMDTDGNPVDNPFQDVIRGTDLGIFARDPYDAGFTYIFLGDTDNPGESAGIRDAYLKIPNNELYYFITQPTLSDTDMTDFLGYLQREHPTELGPFDFLFEGAEISGLHVPTGAFFNELDRKYYVFYALEMNAPLYNNDTSFLIRNTPSASGFPWDAIIGDIYHPEIEFLSRGPGVAGYSAWTRPSFGGGKFINIATVPVNTEPGNTLTAVLSDENRCTLYSSEPAFLLFGTGKYRDSAVYLAWVPRDSVGDKSSYKYFSDLNEIGRNCWSENEEDAVAVALNGDEQPLPLGDEKGAGEISVIYIRNLNIFVMAFTIIRSADITTPPTGALVNMMYSPDGLPWKFNPLDLWAGPTQVFEVRQYRGENQNAYGPYFVPGMYDYHPDTNSIDLYHVASTWNGLGKYSSPATPYSVESRKLTLNIVDRQPVDTVYLVDETGSMALYHVNGDTRWQAARRVLLNFLDGKISDYNFEKRADTAVVLFNYDESYDLLWGEVPLPVYANDDVVTWGMGMVNLSYYIEHKEAASGCNNPTPTEPFMCTSIGNGLNLAFDQFRPDTGRRRAVVLLTDGFDNITTDTSSYYLTPSQAVEAYFSSGPPETSIYAVALGPSTSDDYLNDIAGHGSVFYKSLNGDNLPEIYQAIESETLGYSVVKTAVDGENAHAAVISPDDYMMKISLSANLSDEPLGRRLLAVSPEGMYGERLYISEEQDGVSITESETAFVMTIRQPRPGLWQVFETMGGQVVPATPPSDTSRAFLVTTASGISIDAELVERKYYEGQTARVKIEVKRNGIPVCDGGGPGQPQCSVGIAPEVTWVDRGPGPHEHVLDPASVSVIQVGVGVYELRFPVEISGTYSVKFDVSFDRSNLAVERSKRLSFFVRQAIPVMDIDDSIVGPTTLEVDRNTLVAGSQQGALVTLDLRNYLGGSLPGREVYFASNLGSYEGQVIDHGNGIYSQTFIPGTRAGIAEITAVAKERIDSPVVPEPDGSGVAAQDVGAPETLVMSAKLGRIAQVEIRPAAVNPASCDLGLASSLEFLYRDGSDRVRLTLRDAFGNVVTEPADVAFYLLEANGSVLEGDVESTTAGVYEQAIRGSSRYVTTVIGASVNGIPVDQVASLPVFDSHPWSSDCDGDGFPDPGQGLVCRSMDEWWSPTGTYECNFETEWLECDAPAAWLQDSGFYWRPGIRAFDVDAQGHAVVLRAALLEVLQPGEARTGVGMVGRTSLAAPGFDVEVAGTYAFVASRKGVQVVDIADPESPLVITTVESEIPLVSIETDGKYLYAADGYGLSVYSLSEMENPVEISRLDVFECWCDALCRAWAMVPLPHPLSVDRGYTVLGDGDTLHILDVTRPSSPEWLGSYEASGGFSTLKLWRRFVYLDNAAREIVDIRIPEEPVPAGSHDVADWVEGAKRTGDWVFTTEFSFLRAARILIGE